MQIKRRKARIVKIGNIRIGGDNPVAIQSMAKVKSSDVERVVKQIRELEDCGCEIVRLAIKDSEDAKAIRLIKRKVKIPLVADIHFNWKLAIEAIESGVDKIRLNPGNIYKKEEVGSVVSALKSAKIPLRVGVNSGSVRGKNNYKTGMPQKLVGHALNYIKILEGLKFYDTVISLKASNVLDTVEAYRIIAGKCDYPLHLGVTATGTPYAGAIKSAIGLGALLMEGVGDTIRVSLTDAPQEEVKAARIILEAVKARNFGPEIISCPTCGRCEVDLGKIVRELEKNIAAAKIPQGNKPVKVAVMGCVVNGPGEAVDADIGVAFGRKEGLLFKKGKPIKKVSFKECAAVILKEMEIANDRSI